MGLDGRTGVGINEGLLGRPIRDYLALSLPLVLSLKQRRRRGQQSATERASSPACLGRFTVGIICTNTTNSSQVRRNTTSPPTENLDKLCGHSRIDSLA